MSLEPRSCLMKYLYNPAWSISLLVYTVSLVSCVILCLAPDSIFKSSRYDKESPIFNSIKSIEHTYALGISVGCCLPAIFDFISDLISYKSLNQGFLSRFIMICSILIPDMITQAVIIQHERPEYLGCFGAMGGIIFLCAVCGFLTNNGGSIFKSKLFIAFYIFSNCNIVVKGFLSVSDARIFEFISLGTSLILIPSYLILLYQWLKSLRGTLWEDITPTQYNCSIYMFCLCATIIYSGIIHQTGIEINDSSSPSSLIINRFNVFIFALIVTLFHGRISRLESSRAQKSLERKPVASPIRPSLTSKPSLSFGGLGMSVLRIDVKDSGHGISKFLLRSKHTYIYIYLSYTINIHTVARSIVHLHEGQIYATSEGEGQGCTFSIELPIEIRGEIVETSVRTSLVRNGSILNMNRRSRRLGLLNRSQIKIAVDDVAGNSNSNKIEMKRSESMKMFDSIRKQVSEDAKAREEEINICPLSSKEEFNNLKEEIAHS
eukprot:gene4189-8327_t